MGACPDHRYIEAAFKNLDRETNEIYSELSSIQLHKSDSKIDG